MTLVVRISSSILLTGAWCWQFILPHSRAGTELPLRTLYHALPFFLSSLSFHVAYQYPLCLVLCTAGYLLFIHLVIAETCLALFPVLPVFNRPPRVVHSLQHPVLAWACSIVISCLYCSAPHAGSHSDHIVLHSSPQHHNVGVTNISLCTGQLLIAPIHVTLTVISMNIQGHYSNKLAISHLVIRKKMLLQLNKLKESSRQAKLQAESKPDEPHSWDPA